MHYLKCAKHEYEHKQNTDLLGAYKSREKIGLPSTMSTCQRFAALPENSGYTLLELALRI